MHNITIETVSSAFALSKQEITTEEADPSPLTPTIALEAKKAKEEDDSHTVEKRSNVGERRRSPRTQATAFTSTTSPNPSVTQRDCGRERGGGQQQRKEKTTKGEGAAENEEEDNITSGVADGVSEARSRRLGCAPPTTAHCRSRWSDAAVRNGEKEGGVGTQACMLIVGEKRCRARRD